MISGECDDESFEQFQLQFTTYIFDILQITSISKRSIERFPYQTSKSPHIGGTEIIATFKSILSSSNRTMNNE